MKVGDMNILAMSWEYFIYLSLHDYLLAGTNVTKGAH